jgi:hypothetical protein
MLRAVLFLVCFVVGCGEGEPGCPEDRAICGAFTNDGSWGGRVSVSIDEATNEAIVATSGLAAHEMGPYGANPNQAIAQDFEFRIPLEPIAGPSPAGFGHVGVAWDGVSLFNPSDARDLGGCLGNAAFIEADQVDPYGGHPTGRGEYHYHSGAFLHRAPELGLSHDPSQHSSLVGYAFDGVPIYGPFGYEDGGDRSSAIRELLSCYRIRAERICCQDPTRCSTTSVFERKTLGLGAFVEDFEFDSEGYASGECDLDQFNSRSAVTPEYPEGTRVYVMTFDREGNAAFPLVFGTQYWGQRAEQ